MMLRVSHYANMLWKVALAGACAAMVILLPNWRVALSTETYYQQGRMTGGGSCITDAGVHVTHGFELHCDATDEPNNLEINWDQGNNFHLESLNPELTFCTDDPNFDQKPPVAPLDTYIGSGTGRFNGVSGYTVDFVFTDAGEPGTDDTLEIVISLGNSLILNTGPECPLEKGGNHQAHKQN